MHVQAVEIFGTEWQFSIAPSDGWVPAWRDPCIAAVVVGSLIMALLLLRLQISQERHAMLLRTVLPKRALTRVQRGQTSFMEHFECVTVLCCEIVRYSGMSGTLTPLDVTIFLNELFTLLDSLSQKHGVYKVDTAGGGLYDHDHDHDP